MKNSFFLREQNLFWHFFALYFIFGLAFVFLSKFWTDESWYFGGSWLVANGEIPYRDFFVHHNPLLFYVYALPQYLCGPNLIVGRLTSLVIMMLIFLLVWRLARKLGGQKAALIGGGLLISNLFVVYYFTAFSYRALEACLMLVFFTILLGNLRDSIKYPLATLPLCLIVGIRYPIDFVSGLLVLYLAYVAYRCWKRKRVVLMSLSVAVLSLGGILLPFIILARDQFIFGTVAFNFLTPSFWVEFGISGQPGIIDRLYHIFFIQSGVCQAFYAIVARLGVAPIAPVQICLRTHKTVLGRTWRIERSPFPPLEINLGSPGKGNGRNPLWGSSCRHWRRPAERWNLIDVSVVGAIALRWVIAGIGPAKHEVETSFL